MWVGIIITLNPKPIIRDYTGTTIGIHSLVADVFSDLSAPPQGQAVTLGVGNCDLELSVMQH